MKQIHRTLFSSKQRQNKLNRIQEEDVLYWIFVSFFTAAIIFAAVVYRFELEEIFFVPCPLNRLTGWYCPGCGGTRAVKALLRGEFVKSFLYHPLVPCAGLFFLIFLGSHTLKYLTKGRIRGICFRKGYLFAAAALIIGNFFIKNYLLFVKGIDLLADTKAVF